MRFFILFLAIVSQIFAINLLTYNLYERSDRVDIMLSFDSPYDGQIFQEKNGNLTSLKLSDLSYNRLIKKDINSKIVQNLTIEPNKNFLKIIIKSDIQIGVIASKTTDGFGLRIRIKSLNAPKQNSNTLLSKNSKKSIYADQSQLDTRYIVVIAILLFLLILMFWIKKRYSIKTNPSNKNSWLFKRSFENSQEIKIVYKKQIDTNNSVVLLEFENRRYLVMSGNSNLLLDSFGDGELKDKSEFERAFEDNRKKLDEYLKLQDQKLENFKAKASDDFQKEFDFTK